MCFDICTINIRVSIRVRGLHLVSVGGGNAERWWREEAHYQGLHINWVPLSDLSVQGRWFALVQKFSQV